jgi:DNA-binding CsgD family transcriptional regulator
MTVSDDRLGLADPSRTVTIPLRTAENDPEQRVPVRPPGDADDLPRYLQSLSVLADGDELAPAYAGCVIAVDAAVRWRAAAPLAAAWSLRACVAHRAGDLPDAVHAGRVAAEVLYRTGDPRGEAGVLLLARRVAALLDRGEHARAERLLVLGGAADGELPDDDAGLALRHARGRLRAAAGRPGDGLADLFRCGERLAARRDDHPAALPWRSAAAAVLARLGAPEAAERLVRAEVALARDAGPASALGRALRVHGVVLGAPAGLPVLDEAVRVLGGAPCRLELAEALVDQGALLTAARRRPQARRVLRDGVELAESCGSPALTARARDRYAAAGGPLRPGGGTGAAALSPAEGRAARLAALGHTNRQIAEALFVGVRTVEIHLTNAYRKLGIAGRAELAAALGEP